MLFVPCPVSSEGEAYSFIYLSVRGIEPRVSLESVWQMVTTEPHLRPKRWSPPFHCENWGINCVCGHLCHLPVSLCSLGSPPPPVTYRSLSCPVSFRPHSLCACSSVCLSATLFPQRVTSRFQVHFLMSILAPHSVSHCWPL